MNEIMDRIAWPFVRSLIVRFWLVLTLFCIVSGRSDDGTTRADEVPNRDVAATADAEKVNPYFEHLISPDRTLLRRYDQAMRLIRGGRYAEAGQLLGSILEETADYLLPPPYHGPELRTPDEPEGGKQGGTATAEAKKRDAWIPAERTTDRSFADLLLEEIRDIPAKGRESYTLQYETQAERLLDNAVRQGAFDEVLRVAEHYFPTDAGAQATFLVGMSQFEQGAWESAATTFQKLRRRHHGVRADASPYEPLLSLTLATCLLHLGRREDARQLLDAFVERFPEPKLLLGGDRPWTPKTSGEILEHLERSLENSEPVSDADWLERTGWLLVPGTATQNPETRAGLPLLELLWSVPSLSQPVLDPQAKLLQGHVRQAREVYVPAARPILVDETLLVRGINETTAIDTRTGKRIWSAAAPAYRLPEAVRRALRRHFRQRGLIPQYYAFALRILFWHDRIGNDLSSDGRAVFAVDGLDLLPLASYGGWGAMQRPLRIGNRNIEDPTTRPGNTLTARDVKTGRTLWQIGKYPYVQKVFDRIAEETERQKGKPSISETPDRPRNTDEADGDDNAAARDRAKADGRDETDPEFSEEELFFSETWFLGAPLPLQGRLYTVAETEGVLRLLVLDAETGRLISRVPLAQTSTAFETDWLRRYYGLTPSASNGVLLCPTGLGMVVAVDATTAKPLWCFSYTTPLQNSAEIRDQFRQARYFHFGTTGDNEEFRRMFDKTGWQVPTLMVDANRVLVAPPDDPSLYCLDLETGRLLWRQAGFKRIDALYVACIRRETVYVVTPAAMLAFSMKTGKPVWDARRPDPGRAPGIPATPTDSKLDDGTDRVGFPAHLKPGGVGVHNGNRYFLPFDHGVLGIVDLDRASIDWMAAPSSALAAPKGKNTPRRQPPGRERLEARPDAGDEEDGEHVGDGDEAGSLTALARSFDRTPPLAPSSAQGIPLGNLIGIRGRFFSHAPLQVACFDQLEALRERATGLLRENPEDPEGLLQWGRIRREEGKIAEAVDLFQRSYRAKRTERAADCLRKTLLAAVRADYAEWSKAGPELESLAEFPEELGEILFVLARGALRNGDTGNLLDLLKKAFRLENDHSDVLVAVDDRLTSQLHRALGALIEREEKRNPDPSFRARLGELADSIFRESMPPGTDRSDAFPVAGSREINDRPAGQNDWGRHFTAPSPEIQRLQIFRRLFRTLPIAERADAALRDEYHRKRLLIPLESMLGAPVLGPWPRTAAASENPFVLQPIASAPPPVATPLPELDAVIRWAGLMESRGDLDDAWYYYRLLKEYYGENGAAAYHEAMKRPVLREYYDKHLAPVAWPEGKVVYRDRSGDESARANPRQGDGRNAAIERILRNARPSGRFPTGLAPVPYLGAYEPFLSPYDYFLETTGQDVFLVCCDSFGTERWRTRLSSLIPDIVESAYFTEHSYRRGFSEQTMYLKGCNHLLLLVRENRMIAFDLFDADGENGPRILWSRAATSTLPARRIFSAFGFDSIGSYHTGRSFPRESVFVSPEVVCYRDMGTVYGLDPLNGRTLWTRDVPSDACSILGDREHLFLVFPTDRRAIAVDPECGAESASGILTRGGIVASGTNVVFLQPAAPSLPGRKPGFRILVGDLRDMVGRIPKSSTPPKRSGSDDDSTLPLYVVRDLPTDSLIRPVVHQRYLASVSGHSGTLQIYDLSEKRDILGPEGDWGRRTGVKLPELRSRGPRAHDRDFDVELFEDKFLVHYVDKSDVETAPTNEKENGVAFKRSRSAPTNVPCRGVGSGVLMLYGADGAPCWEEPALISDWFRLHRNPAASPVVLYAVGLNDQDARNVNHHSIGFYAVDKQTGRKRFHWEVSPKPGQPHSLFQGFRVRIEPERREISLIAPGQILGAVFTDEPETPPKRSGAVPEKRRSPLAPPTLRPLFE